MGDDDSKVPRGEWGALVAYLFFGMCGVLVFFAPSVSLAVQGGRLVIYAWGAFCLIGSALGVVGYLRKRTITELWGASFAAAASLTWAVALVLQAIATDNAVALTAAGLASALTALLLQRGIDANRSPRR